MSEQGTSNSYGGDSLAVRMGCDQCLKRELLEAEVERLQAELERTRQAWVDGDDPMCDDVCVVACKGPCNVDGTDQ